VSAYVLLEDGTRFDGEAVGHDGHAAGEVVFTTGMAGYQESVTDPSFAGQLITFTYPHIGNYGVSAEAMESDRIHARAVIMRAAGNHEDAAGAEGGWLDWLRDCGIPAITGVDTRALVRHIRSEGAMRGGVFGERVSESEARDLIAAEPQMAGQDLARTVTPSETARGSLRSTPASRAPSSGISCNAGHAFRCIPATSLQQLCCRRTRMPCFSPTDPAIQPPWSTSWTR
jgi:carbamoyl-phosphate synthase small subunit